MINFILGIFTGIIIGLIISMFIHNTITIYRLTKKYIIHSIDKEFGFRRKKEAKCQIDDGWDACYDEIMMYLLTHSKKPNVSKQSNDYKEGVCDTVDECLMLLKTKTNAVHYIEQIKEKQKWD